MDESAKLAKETKAVRLTEQPWITSLLAKIACRFEEPGALIGHAGIREGGTGQPVSLPRQMEMA